VLPNFAFSCASEFVNASCMPAFDAAELGLAVLDLLPG
jgi:hypothetical protein